MLIVLLKKTKTKKTVLASMGCFFFGTLRPVLTDQIHIVKQQQLIFSKSNMFGIYD